jgi:hypothetical protein
VKKIRANRTRVDQFCGNQAQPVRCLRTCVDGVQGQIPCLGCGSLYTVNHHFEGSHCLQLQPCIWKHFVLSRRKCPSYQTTKCTKPETPNVFIITDCDPAHRCTTILHFICCLCATNILDLLV